MVQSLKIKAIDKSLGHILKTIAMLLHSICCHWSQWRPLWSLSQRTGLMSMVCATAKLCDEVHVLYLFQVGWMSMVHGVHWPCYLWSPCECPWSMLSPEVMLLSIVYAITLLMFMTYAAINEHDGVCGLHCIWGSYLSLSYLLSQETMLRSRFNADSKGHVDI